MSKYIIMHGSQWHETFDDFEEADNYYWEMVDEEGDWFDLTLCKILESHEASRQPHEPLTNGRHWNIDTSPLDDIAKSWKRSMKNIHSEWFNRGKY